jgi:hypothetical protein
MGGLGAGHGFTAAGHLAAPSQRLADPVSCRLLLEKRAKVLNCRHGT